MSSEGGVTAERETFVASPGAVGALSAAVARGDLDPEAVLDAALARIDAVDPAVQGWRVVDRDGARAQVRRLKAALAAGQSPGPLCGIPVAVKDVIDVAGLPTRAGSRTRAQAPPCSIDAHVVTLLRAAGAVVLGKAHTTEFAFFDGPPPTRNPHDLSRTPGGSSSGPAAVVAAGMVPLSLGTQTAGSVSRPAAYCGIAAFKPSTRAWSSFGVVPFAPSFDTVGVFGYRMVDAALAARALMPEFLPLAAPRRAEELRIAVLEDAVLAAASDGVARVSVDVVRKLNDAGIAVTSFASPVSLAMIGDLHLTMREHELGHAHASLRDAPEGDVTPSLREAVARGNAIDPQHYLDAVSAMAAARQQFWQVMAGFDAVIFPAAPDIAPVGMATGDASFIVPFTALGGPIASVPAGFDQGLPLGIMLAGAPGSDLTLLGIAERFAPLIETPR